MHELTPEEETVACEKAKLACPLVPESEIEDHYSGPVVILLGGDKSSGMSLFTAAFGKTMRHRFVDPVPLPEAPLVARVTDVSPSRYERRRQRFGRHDSWKSPEDRR